MERRKSEERRRRTADHETITVRDIARRIWRLKLLALGVFLVPAAAGTVWLQAQPNIYRATASIILEDQNANVAEFSQALPSAKFDDMTLDTQAKVLSSPALMRSVVDTLGLHLDARGRLAASTISGGTAGAQSPDSGSTPDYKVMERYAHDLVVTPEQSSRVIDISFQTTDPALAAAIVNTHTKAYVASEIQMRRQQDEQIKKWIEGQVDALKKQDSSKSEAIQRFQQQAGMINGGSVDGGGSTDLIYQQISELSTQLATLEAHRLELQARANSQGKTNSNQAETDVLNSPLIQTLKSQSSAAHQELQAASTDYGPNHPKYLEAQQKVAEADAALNREIGNIQSSVSTDLATVTDQENLLRGRLEAAKGQADVIRQKQVQLQSMQVEETASGKLLDSFLAHYGEIESQLDFTHADVRIAALADVPMEPTGPSHKMMLALILFLSAILSIGVTALLSLRDTGVETADDARRVLNLRLLGIMPKVRDSVQEVRGRKSSAYYEEVKRIYLHLSAKGTGSTLLVTEARHGEGKAGFTNALAAYLASIGQRVAVIAADPSNKALDPTETGPGLADVLAGESGLAEAVRPCDLGFDVLPLGNGRVDFSAATTMKDVLSQMRTQFDYVLVDAAPVLASTDSEALARLVDQVVMVVAQSRTSRRKLKAVAQMLRQFSTDVPYALLSQANLKAARGH
jgi:succinoglycan biosynthesis transport protein ExoP